jgi:hypothetical protein
MCTNMLGQRRRPEVIDHEELSHKVADAVTLSPDELLLTLRDQLRMHGCCTSSIPNVVSLS